MGTTAYTVAASEPGGVWLALGSAGATLVRKGGTIELTPEQVQRLGARMRTLEAVKAAPTRKPAEEPETVKTVTAPRKRSTRKR